MVGRGRDEVRACLGETACVQVQEHLGRERGGRTRSCPVVEMGKCGALEGRGEERNMSREALGDGRNRNKDGMAVGVSVRQDRLLEVVGYDLRYNRAFLSRWSEVSSASTERVRHATAKQDDRRASSPNKSGECIC